MGLVGIMYGWRHYFINTLIWVSNEAISSEDLVSLKHSYIKSLNLLKEKART